MIAFLLILPIICDAKIQINITVASNKRDAVISFSGADKKLITDHEIELFNISMVNLNRGVRVELGKVPDGGIYLKDPTPYGNVFHKFKWPEIQRNLHVERVQIHEMITKKVVLKQHEHVNYSADDSQSERSLFVDVENSAYSNWSAKGLPDEDIFYDVLFKCANTSFKYENKWRNRSLKSSFVRFGTSDQKSMTLKPGRGIVKTLTALKTIFVLRVDYKAQLTGNIIADYENLYGKYHFYAPTIDNIMVAGKIVNEIVTSEKIEIRCFTDPRLDIYDKDTGALIKFQTGRLFWKQRHNKSSSSRNHFRLDELGVM